MESETKWNLRDAPTQSELEAAMIASVRDLSISCMTFVPCTLAVFVKPPMEKAWLVRTHSMSGTANATRQCRFYAATALRRRFGGGKTILNLFYRTIDIDLDSHGRATMVQVVQAPDAVCEADALRRFNKYHDHGMPSAFAVMMPDVVWGTHFPSVAGELYALWASTVSVGDAEARVLCAFCCIEHARKLAKERGRAIQEILNGSTPAVTPRTWKGPTPFGSPLDGDDLFSPFGWMVTRIVLEDIGRNNWMRFCGAFDSLDFLEWTSASDE